MDDGIWHIPAHDPIRDRTSDHNNRRIDRRTWESVHSLDSPSAIRARLAELDHEWNVDRALMLEVDHDDRPAPACERARKVAAGPRRATGDDRHDVRAEAVPIPIIVLVAEHDHHF